MAIDFRLRDFCYPVGIWKLRRFLERSQWAEPEVLRDYQRQRLRALIEHAYGNVPYYRDLFKSLRLKPADIKGPEDLHKLPILTKPLVRAHFEELKARNAWRFFPRLYRTSGSTGTPLEIYHDRNSNVLEFATYWWHWGWAGYRLGDKFLAIRGVRFRTRPRLKNRLWSFDPRLRALYLSPLRMNPKEIDLYAERIKRFKPKFLLARPTTLALFAHCLREGGIHDLHFKAVFTGGANLSERDVKLFMELFHCKVYDSYGLMERAANIRQCGHGSYHINQVFGIVEVLDEREQPVGPGQNGRIVGTGLHNWAMPLIRYDTSDLCAAPVSDAACACGRRLPLVRSIYGFTEDPVVLPDGRRLTGLGRALKVAWGIKMGQIVQTRKDRIEVRLVKDSSYSENDAKAILEELLGRVGDGVELKIVFVDRIELTEEGKFKWVRSEISSP